jgi:hypothetical protein
LSFIVRINDIIGHIHDIIGDLMTFDTNNDARAAFEAAGITSGNITEGQLSALSACLDSHMRNSGAYDGQFRMHGTPTKYLKCASHFWKGREAVSFNRDGFIGIGGWADTTNTRILLAGIAEFLTLDNVADM